MSNKPKNDNGPKQSNQMDGKFGFQLRTPRPQPTASSQPPKPPAPPKGK